MARLSYAEQLKHPLWQKRRLEVLEKANFQCWNCGHTDKTLHVHHCYYERGKSVWEYPDHALRSLCEDCHKEAGEKKLALDKLLSESGNEDEIYGYALGAYMRSHESEEVPIEGYEIGMGVADFYGISEGYLFAFLNKNGPLFGHKRALFLIFHSGSSKRYLVMEAGEYAAKKGITK